MALGMHINHIKRELKMLNEKYGVNRLAAVGDFFNLPIKHWSNIVSFKFWSRVWSTYSMYDPSYANQESFGFFVDVGNGWTTIGPSLLWLYHCTTHARAASIVPSVLSALPPTAASALVTPLTALVGLSPRLVGMVGLVSFYQEFYGTVIYFLQFFFNGRQKGKSVFEVLLFVGLSNGLWFFFPLLGMYVSYHCVTADTWDVMMMPQ